MSRLQRRESGRAKITKRQGSCCGDFSDMKCAKAAGRLRPRRGSRAAQEPVNVRRRSGMRGIMRLEFHPVHPRLMDRSNGDMSNRTNVSLRSDPSRAG